MTYSKRLHGLTFIYAAILVSIVLAANAGRLPVQYLLPGSDKLGHFLLMGGLSFLVNLSFSGLGRRGFTVFRVTLGLWLVVAVEEISQIWQPRRSFEWQDLAADTAGIVVFALLAAAILSWTRRTARTAT